MTSANSPRLSREAILARARNAGIDGGEALRDIAFNQLLARLDVECPGEFMLKGAQALRVRGVSNRTTRDLDIRTAGPNVREAVARLLQAVEVDLGDGVLFQLRREPTSLGAVQTGGYEGVKVSLEALIDGRLMANLSIDLVTGREPSGHVARLPRPMIVPVPGLADAYIDTYPVEDHIGDKVFATMTRFAGRTSTRRRDLYDLCAFALRSSPQAAAMGTAFEEERVRRGIEPFAALEVPNDWPRQWPKLLQMYPDPEMPADIAVALALVRGLVDPVLTGLVTRGRWDPRTSSWAD